MSDVPTEVDALPVEPYRPFPSFAEFANVPFDSSTFEQFVGVLEKAKAQADVARLEAAVRTATRWAAVDTGAIENLYQVDRGFTYTVATEAAAWDNMHVTVGDDAARAIGDALTAYDYVLDMTTGEWPVSEAGIKELHKIICASQDTFKVQTAIGEQQHELLKGEYKRHPNNPFNLSAQAVHSYAPVVDVAPEMSRFIEEVRTDEFVAAHPVLQAAYAHYAFVCIHPFSDGNGRVSRALASIFLYRSPGVPLVVFADQKADYLDGLEAADAGDTRLFVQFMTDRAVDVVRMVAREMQRKQRLSRAEREAQLQAALLGRGGLPHEAIDATASQMLDTWRAALQSANENNPPPGPISMAVQVVAQGIPGRQIPTGYRYPPPARVVHLVCQAGGLGAAKSQRLFGVVVAKGEGEGTDFLLIDSTGVLIEEALLREVHPTVSPALIYRMEVAAEEIVLDLTDQVAEASEQALRDAGYKD